MLPIRYQASPAHFEKAVAILERRARESHERQRRKGDRRISVPGVIAALFTLAVVAPLVIMFSGPRQVSIWWAVYFAAAGVVFGAFVGVWQGLRRENTWVRSMLGLRGEMTARLTDDGFETQLNDTRSVTPWHAFTSASVANGLVLLERGSDAVEYVPVEAFASKEEGDAFLARAIEYIAVANGRVQRVARDPEAFKRPG